MTLDEIEESLQARLDYLDKKEAEGFEQPPFEAWLEIYQVLAQVKQAQHLEFIARAIDNGNEIKRIAEALENLISVLPRS